MFNESYYIFSVGNVKPIWTEQYPECWKVHIQKLLLLSSKQPLCYIHEATIACTKMTPSVAMICRRGWAAASRSCTP